MDQLNLDRVNLLHATEEKQITFFGLETAQVDKLDYPKIVTPF